MSDETTRPGPDTHHRSLLGRLDHLMFQFFGPAEGEVTQLPVVHHHDVIDDEIEDQLRSVEVETDAEGRHYGTQKHVPEPVIPVAPFEYQYYSGRPPLKAPET